MSNMSDAHIGPLPKPWLRDVISKGVTGYVN